MAFEKVLRPWCATRNLLCEGDRWLIDKPAGVASDGRLVERVGAKAFEVHWSPPERASGTALLGPARTLKGSEPAFRAVVLVWDGGSGRRWRGSLSTSGGQLELESLGRRGQLELGRVQVPAGMGVEGLLEALRERRWPVVGGGSGPVATRLWLHVEALAAQGLESSPSAPLPSEFWRAVSSPRPTSASDLEALLLEQGVTRWGSSRERDVVRLGGETSGELCGATVDAYGDSALLAVSSAEVASRVDAMADCLMDLGAARVYVKHRVRGDLRSRSTGELAPPEPIRGSGAGQRVVRVGAAGNMQVWLDRGHSTGVFIDQSRNWARVRSRAAGCRVLNLFCYSGAFTLAAGLGGAKETCSVDLAASALRLLRENLVHNGLSGGQHRLHKDDVASWLRRAVRRSERFDRIVIDPPSFGSRKRGVFRLEQELEELLELASRLLTPGGSLLTVGHHRGLTTERVRQMVQTAAGRAGIGGTATVLCADWDCPTVPGASTTYSVWFDAMVDGAPCGGGR